MIYQKEVSESGVSTADGGLGKAGKDRQCMIRIRFGFEPGMKQRAYAPPLHAGALQLWIETTKWRELCFEGTRNDTVEGKKESKKGRDAW